MYVELLFFAFALLVSAVLGVGLALLVILFIVAVAAAAHFYAEAPFVSAGVDIPWADSVASGAATPSDWLYLGTSLEISFWGEGVAIFSPRHTNRRGHS